ncbi:MAG: S26 family signal peptidase [Candidatus Aenigmarchaeota archaeon]|nr:S26 family signal peptidase [Candidatus Aenigmarchaeota archaeon]
MNGASMEPLYSEGDFVFAVAWPFRFKKGDVVIIEKSGRKMLKRIRALGAISNDGEYSVLGDNSGRSTDSRHFGAVARKEIIAKVLFKA